LPRQPAFWRGRLSEGIFNAAALMKQAAASRHQPALQQEGHQPFPSQAGKEGKIVGPCAVAEAVKAARVTTRRRKLPTDIFFRESMKASHA